MDQQSLFKLLAVILEKESDLKKSIQALGESSSSRRISSKSIVTLVHIPVLAGKTNKTKTLQKKGAEAEFEQMMVALNAQKLESLNNDLMEVQGMKATYTALLEECSTVLCAADESELDLLSQLFLTEMACPVRVHCSFAASSTLKADLRQLYPVLSLEFVDDDSSVDDPVIVAAPAPDVPVLDVPVPEAPAPVPELPDFDAGDSCVAHSVEELLRIAEDVKHNLYELDVVHCTFLADLATQEDLKAEHLNLFDLHFVVV